MQAVCRAIPGARGSSRSTARRRPCPRSTPAKSAQSTNGTTAIPMTETASRKHTGPASSRTSRPTAKAVSGFSASVSAHARTGWWKRRLRTRYTRKKMPTMPQTHGRSGTMSRPQSSPRVIHGTMASSRPPNVAGPDDDLLAAGHEFRRGVERAGHDHEIPANPWRRTRRGAAADDNQRAVDRRRCLPAALCRTRRRRRGRRGLQSSRCRR